MSAQGYQTKHNSYSEGGGRLEYAIARLLHTVFVPTPQKSKSSVVTGLFMQPLKKCKMLHTITQPQPPNSNPEMAPYLMVWSDAGFWIRHILPFRPRLCYNLVPPWKLRNCSSSRGVAPTHGYRHPDSAASENKIKNQTEVNVFSAL